MQIAGPHHHRALLYVKAVSAQGYNMTVAELQAYVDAPVVLTPSDFMARLAGMDTFVKLGVVQMLRDSRWIVVRDGRVEITDLGSAVARTLEAEETPGIELINVTLDPNDPFSYARLIGHIASRGKALLVDPYFEIDQLQDVLLSTEVTRLLTSDRESKGRIASLRTALSSGTLSRTIEIRLAPHGDMHDRYVIPDDGPVDMIGTSLNGVGKRPSAVVELHTGSDEIRRLHEEIWDKATPL
jgi:hypothetical protein